MQRLIHERESINWLKPYWRTSLLVIDMKLEAKKSTNNKTISFAPDSKEHTDVIISVVREFNPLIALFLDVQRFTGLRYSDCSRITLDNIAKSSTQIRSQFTIVQKKIYSGAITRFRNNKNGKYENHTEEELHNLAIEKASLRIFISDKLKELFLDVIKLQKNNPRFNIRDKESFVFTGTHHHSKGAISKEAINQLLKSEKVRLELAKHGISNENLGTHSLRKDFGQRLLEKKATVVDIKELLGQASLDSTIRYLSTSDKKKKDLVNSISNEGFNSHSTGVPLEHVEMQAIPDTGPHTEGQNERIYALVEKAIESGSSEAMVNMLLSKIK